ncbi:type II secretion system F family protein [Dactylosporangium sp. CS-047395]|uniref:type II secretion system F family protein n=1 Tax=Dactylosporangium sp. CS-047395 TaxID=3239936 RepID=UPI003D8E747D
MSALDLALFAGVLPVAGWLAHWLRARRPSARLARVARELHAPRPARRRLELLLLRRPVLACAAVLAPIAGGGLAALGPVAAVVLPVYCLLALAAVRRHLIRRDADRLVAGLLDAVDATAEGLRAGALPDGSTVPLHGGGVHERWAGAAVEVARGRLLAAYRLSEHLGVPLVDLLERVEADLRAAQALRAEMSAQLAGAQTSTAVLIPLPLLGLWVGSAMGIDPAQLLLHTPLGAACALAAVAMQCLGLLWTSRMVHTATAEVR